MTLFIIIKENIFIKIIKNYLRLHTRGFPPLGVVVVSVVVGVVSVVVVSVVVGVGVPSQIA